MTVKEWYTTYNFAIMQKSNENIALYKDFIFKLREETGLTKKEIGNCFCNRVAAYKYAEKYLKKSGQI
jgi:hypothetical protein